MKHILLMIAVVALVGGCRKEVVSNKEAKNLNAEVVRQGLEKEIEKLMAENTALKTELAAAKKAPPPRGAGYVLSASKHSEVHWGDDCRETLYHALWKIRRLGRPSKRI